MSESREILRRKALLAASSVVLAFGLAGCTGTASADADKLDDSGGDTSADTDTYSDTDTDTDTDTVDTSDTSDTSDTASDARPDCSTVSSTEIVTCCNDLADWCNEAYTDRDAADECVYGPGYDGSTGCIPWGPPAPPRLRAVA